MDKVIFLDVDGVLNIHSESYRTNDIKHDYHFPTDMTRLEFHLVKRLEYIIDQTDADIVLCSGWDIETLKKVLYTIKFKYIDKIIDEVNSMYMIESIVNYVKKHNITNYIVLDDEIGGLDFELLGKYLPTEIDKIPFTGTKVNHQDGLTNENALYAINWLNKTGTLAKFK